MIEDENIPPGTVVGVDPQAVLAAAREAEPPHEIAPELVAMLDEAVANWGAMGVALAAAERVGGVARMLDHAPGILPIHQARWKVGQALARYNFRLVEGGAYTDIGRDFDEALAEYQAACLREAGHPVIERDLTTWRWSGTCGHYWTPVEQAWLIGTPESCPIEVCPFCHALGVVQRLKSQSAADGTLVAIICGDCLESFAADTSAVGAKAAVDVWRLHVAAEHSKQAPSLRIVVA